MERLPTIARNISSYLLQNLLVARRPCLQPLRDMMNVRQALLLWPISVISLLDQDLAEVSVDGVHKALSSQPHLHKGSAEPVFTEDTSWKRGSQ